VCEASAAALRLVCDKAALHKISQAARGHTRTGTRMENSRKSQFEITQKKPPPLPCATVPLNMFYNMWNLPGCFRLPAKACRPQPRRRLLDRLTTVQGLVANHKQGRVNPVFIPKSDSVQQFYRLFRWFSQAKFLKIYGDESRSRQAAHGDGSFSAMGTASVLSAS